MTKADIVANISEKLGLEKGEAQKVVELFMETVKESLANGENVYLRGFGSFKVVKRAPRVARNPKTNQEVAVPAQFVPVLKVSKDFKTAVHKSLS